MAQVTSDRVRDTTTTTGTGAVTVSGTAPTTYRTFSTVCSTNDTFFYAIVHQTADEWEIGLGTYSASNQVTRTTVLASTNSGSAVSFSAGTKDIFITNCANQIQNVRNTQTASYTTVMADMFKTIVMNVASGNNLTVANNTNVAFPLETRIDIFQYGAGQTTIVADTGLTIRSKGGNLKLTGQYSGASLTKIATNEWILIGDLAA
jgi:hypothetical protein